jgi:hypothetical protein
LIVFDDVDITCLNKIINSGNAAPLYLLGRDGVHGLLLTPVCTLLDTQYDTFMSTRNQARFVLPQERCSFV